VVLSWNMMAGRARSEVIVLTHRPLAISRGGDIDVRLLDEHDANHCKSEDSMAAEE
jgi:hypothetical protein